MAFFISDSLSALGPDIQKKM